MFNHQILIQMKSKMEKEISFRMLAAIMIIATMSFIGCKDDNGGDDPDTPDTLQTVTNVEVTPASPSVAKGATQQFSATVTGDNKPAQTVTWSIVETNKHASTAISGAGLLTVAAGESLAKLTVRAVSTVDATKNGTASVTVTGGGSSGSGVTWTKVTANPFGTSAINDIILGNDILVATGTFSKIAYSNDNINQWTTLDLSELSLGNIYRIARGGGRYVVINYQGTAAYADENDVTKWKKTDKENEPFFETQVYNPGIVYCKDRFIAHRNGVMKYSTDGGATWKNTSWTGGGATPFTNIYGIVWNGTRFIAVGGKGNFPTSGVIAHSTDGETWTEVTGHPFSDVAVYGFTWDGNKFIAIAPWRVAHSSDGLDWSLYYNDSFSNPSSNRITFGGGKYIVVGDSGKNGEIWTSTDAKTWLKEEVSVFSNYVTVKSIIYDGKKFIVAGVEDDKNVIAYSNDLQ